MLQDTWKSFSLNIEKALSCTINVWFKPYEYELEYIIPGVDRSPTLLTKGGYNETIVREQIDRYARVILEGIYKALERLTEERIERQETLQNKKDETD